MVRKSELKLWCLVKSPLQEPFYRFLLFNAYFETDGMNKRLAFLLALIFLSLVAVGIPLIKAQSVGNIIINADGSVTGTNSIQQAGNTYSFTANVTGNVEVHTSNIVLNGSGYSLNGKGSFGIDLNDPNSYPTLPVNNVTIENLYITNCGFGMISNGGSNFTFYDDYIPYCFGDACIMLIGNCEYNNIAYCTIIGSNVTEAIGMVGGASYNTITENNIIGSGVNVYMSGSETIDNNYWISTNGNIQGSALNKPVAISLTGLSPIVPEFQAWTILLLLIMMMTAGLLVYFKKRMR